MPRVDHRSLLILPPFPLLIFMACEPGNPPGQGVLRWDSAGIEIVETHVPAWSGENAWAVDTGPALTIGTVEGEDPHLFGGIVGAARLEDGTIVVGDGLLLEVRAYDGDGKYLKTVAGPGEGPGELGRFTRLVKCGKDRLYVEEPWNNRVTVFNPDLAFETRIPLLQPTQLQGSVFPHGPYHWACSSSGDFLAIGWGEADPAFRRSRQAALYIDTAPVWILDSLGVEIVEFGDYPVSERVLIPGLADMPHPLGRSTSLALGDTLAYIGTSERLEILVHRRSGGLARILRSPSEDPSIQPEKLERYGSADLTEDERSDWDRLENVGLEAPGAIPAYTELRIDGDGFLWIKRFQWPWESRGRWGVFSPDGIFLGHVVMPDKLTVFEIGRDFVLGGTKDEWDVERIQLHVLRRGH